ncbi:MAG: hypothetical protein ABL931_17780 [Usitatibacteraceae bacterium]
MNMTQKFATSFVAVAAVSVVLFTSANADSMKHSQPVQVVAASQSLAVAPLNSPETPASQLDDLQYK